MVADEEIMKTHKNIRYIDAKYPKCLGTKKVCNDNLGVDDTKAPRNIQKQAANKSKDSKQQ